ncbi:putative LRR receptor-like serine/threonine-protein kinase RFK1, partial [Mucuna pruriens]
MYASGLEGPIPSNISLLSNLNQLEISDINGPSQDFPILGNMKGMTILVLRNCHITGELPSYFWSMKSLNMLDVSFNKLVGEIPVAAHAGHTRFLFLTRNMLSGNIPDSVLMDGSNSHCFHVNCGGEDVKVMENDENILYVGDGNVLGSAAAKYFINYENHWGFSSTGDFMDDGDYLNTRYTRPSPSSNLPELYKTARVTPISLTYFHYCLENGKYTVNLHFAEIQFTNDNTFRSLGKRIFDIYVQEILVRKDFNIESETHVAQKPLTIPIYNVTVTDNILEVQFYWAGKGTTRIPTSGVYGPLISAFSIVSDSKPCSDPKNVRHKIIVGAGFGVTALCLVIIIVGIFWWKGYFEGIIRRTKGNKKQDSQKGTFTLKQIRDATDDFSPANMIGEGGFGPVYKGQLSDGTLVAVKQLSSMSRQGNREFLNEIGMISCLQHPNLVKLHGCCIEGKQLMLVYEYMENNNLARSLFSSKNQLKLDWPTRLRICIGIAKGLAFLHEESRLKIVHRDIKATNVLLDGNLNPKISDFGLARLDEEDKSHIITRVAGTIGYMAPEYALWGYLSYKADVYSYGVVVLEVVSGKNNNNYTPSDNCVCLLDMACHLQRTENLIELVDERLGSEVNPTEATNLMKVALLCTDVSPSVRPTMSEVVNMLEGRMSIPDAIPQPSDFSEDIRFKAMRDIHQQRENHSLSTSRTD